MVPPIVGPHRQPRARYWRRCARHYLALLALGSARWCSVEWAAAEAAAERRLGAETRRWWTHGRNTAASSGPETPGHTGAALSSTAGTEPRPAGLEPGSVSWVWPQYSYRTRSQLWQRLSTPWVFSRIEQWVNAVTNNTWVHVINTLFCEPGDIRSRHLECVWTQQLKISIVIFVRLFIFNHE